MTTARDKFRADVAEALTSWRLGYVAPRYDWSSEQETIRAGITEIFALRLMAAYNPIFKTLQRIENQMAIVARPGMLGACARPQSTATPNRSVPLVP